MRRKSGVGPWSLVLANSGGIVGLCRGFPGLGRTSTRLRLAPLEILPQRRPQAPLLPHLLRALSPLVHGCKITAGGRATEALRCEWSLEGACLRHVGPYGKDRSARAPIPLVDFRIPPGAAVAQW